MYETYEFLSRTLLPYRELNERKVMAELSSRLEKNAEGAYYVDSSCVDCDLCRNTAPDFFRRDESGSSIVYRQPVRPEEIELAEEAREGCPTESIGKDGVVQRAERESRMLETES
jgi:ferredoxin